MNIFGKELQSLKIMKTSTDWTNQTINEMSLCELQVDKIKLRAKTKNKNGQIDSRNNNLAVTTLHATFLIADSYTWN